MNVHAEAARDLAADLQVLTGKNVASCYQCGKCSAGCPMAQEMRYPPQQMLRLVQLGLGGRLFADDSLWLCLTCETCTSRCPNDVDPARLIDGLRELAVRRGSPAKDRHIRVFHEAFLDQIRSHGRLFELGLIASYKIRTGAFLGDLGSAPGMLARGKLAFAPPHVRGLDEVRRIFERTAFEKTAFERTASEKTAPSGKDAEPPSGPRRHGKEAP